MVPKHVREDDGGISRKPGVNRKHTHMWQRNISGNKLAGAMAASSHHRYPPPRRCKTTATTETTPRRFWTTEIVKLKVNMVQLSSCKR